MTEPALAGAECTIGWFLQPALLEGGVELCAEELFGRLNPLDPTARRLQGGGLVTQDTIASDQRPS